MESTQERTAIWDRIQSTLDGRGVTQAVVAKSLGIRDTTVNSWYRGRSTPDSVTIGRLCAVFGLNGHWILTGQGNPDAMVQQAVEQADVVGSLAYQAGGRAALAMMSGEIQKAVAAATKAWSTPAGPDPDQLRRVREAADLVSDHLGKADAKKGKRAG